MAACMWIVGALIKSFPPVPGQGISGGQYAAIVLIFVWAVAFCFSVSHHQIPDSHDSTPGFLGSTVRRYSHFEFAPSTWASALQFTGPST